MRYSILVCVAVVLFVNFRVVGQSREAYWDTYMARYGDGVGSVAVNMDLIKTAPVIDLPFIVFTGVSFKSCTGEGFPKKDEFSKLYKISDHVNHVISETTKSELAGTFTYQCKRLDYIFVKDTVNIRRKLSDLYQHEYKSYKYSIDIRSDMQWDAYLTFLYPIEETKRFMKNSRVVSNLKDAGDKLEKQRIIGHWLYFKTKEGRDTFVRYATGLKFRVEGTKDLNEVRLPFQLHVARPDFADLESITTLTRKLNEKAKDYGGEYDGWSSAMMRK